MYFALIFYPQLDSGLEESIEKIRRKYDPTVELSKLHITVLFPVPDAVGEEKLENHIEQVLTDWEPFGVSLGGFHRSYDHWLVLNVVEGGAKIKALYRELYTGILEEYRRDDIDFVPHVGLGLFVKDGSRYDWDHPKEADFDRKKYEEALQQAKVLPLGSSCVVEKLYLVSIPDELLEWTTGKRASIPSEFRITKRREFHLGDRGA
jgi:2'-5' RNA ligase